jgi:hypothetical protein
LKGPINDVPRGTRGSNAGETERLFLIKGKEKQGLNANLNSNLLLRVVAIVGLFGCWALWANCSLVVPGELGQVQCSNEGKVGPPACAQGEICLQGKCMECMMSDTCNDGVDNDCNGTIDDCTTAGSGGAGGQGQSGSAGGLTNLGAPCADNSGCSEDSFCIAYQDLGEVAPGSLCTKPCCQSSQCGDVSKGLVCVPTRSGTGVCLPGSVAQRKKLGVKATGEMCLDGSECRSGWCEGGECNDVCCSDVGCPGTKHAFCQRRMFPGMPERDSFVCSSEKVGNPYADPSKTCSKDSECASNVCGLSVAGTSFKGCTKSCCNSDSCGSISLGAIGGGTYVISCNYLETPNGKLRTCARAANKGDMVPVGKACNQDDQCRSGFCLIPAMNQPGYCSDACCSDADCGGVQELGCGPLKVGSLSELRCQKLPLMLQ